MLKQASDFIVSNHILFNDDKILIAVSGGIDSVVLLDILKKLKYHFAIAHCNFNLRGEESLKDEAFVKELAEKYKVTAHFKKFDTLKYAKLNKVSIQMAARVLRYVWLKSLAMEYNYNKIATAHHHNDNIETILFNLIKGTGIRGLRGILPVNYTNNIVRPLLFATKEEILHYAMINNLLWREDSSNKKDDYHRNLIRNKVIPIMKSINPNLEDTSKRNIERFTNLETFIEKYAQTIDIQNKNNMVTLQKNDLHNVTILEQILCKYGFSYTQCKDIGAAKVGAHFISINKQYVLNVDRDHIFIEPLKNPNKSFIITIYDNKQRYPSNKYDDTYSLNDKLTIKLPNGELTLFCYNIEALKTMKSKEDFIKDKIKNKQNILLLDKDKLSFPIIIRPWAQGDKFKPLGMDNNKKVSDFLIDNKVPVSEKKNIYVIVSKPEKEMDIVGIIGYRIAESFKVTENTNQILEIELG